MFGRTVTLFRMFGFSVRIDLSWLVIFALVIWTLAEGIFRYQYVIFSAGERWLMGLACALGLFFSIIFHEFSHSLVARRYGLSMKGITLFIFGGVAEMGDEPPNAKTEFLMAIAGPIASVGLAMGFYIAFVLSMLADWPMTVGVSLHYLWVINLMLAGFNMIPGFPLDGGRVLRSILWAWKGNLRQATRIAAKVGEIFGFVLIGLGVASLLAGNLIGGLWWLLIGLFIRMAARQGYNQVLIRQALRGEPVRRFMNDQPVTVRPDITLRDLVENFIYRYHYKMFPIVLDGKLMGCITTRQISRVPPGQWAVRYVSEVAGACETSAVSPDEDAMTALSLMNRTQQSRLLVVEDGRLLGILSLKDLLKFLSLKVELEGDEEPRQYRQAG